MSGSFVSALDQTVVGTALPTVVGDLHGVERYGWVFSAYLLATTASIPLYGRIADITGRKLVYVLAFGLFLLGSTLGGLAQTMDQLILFRAVQGMGAGGLLPVGATILGDIFDARQRGRMQGLFAAVWATAALAGPAIGGVITQTLSWRWTFYVNVPICVIAIVALMVGFHERIERHDRQVDWLGAGALVASTLALLIGLGGTPWILPAAALAAATFVAIERRATDPLIDFSLFRIPVVVIGIALNLVIGVVLFDLIAYLPPFIQGVQGGTPFEAGAVVATVNIGWQVASIFIGLVLIRLGLRRAVLIGTATMFAGTATLIALGAGAPRIQAAAAASLVGLGIGLFATPALIAAQAEVEWGQRGAVTSLLQFNRSLGSAVGVAVLGLVLNSTLGGSVHGVGALLVHDGGAGAPGLPDGTRAALFDGLHAVYVGMTVAALAGFILALRLPATIRSAAEARTAHLREHARRERLMSDDERLGLSRGG